ncbi:MAG: hypothetical protein ABIS43_07040 [Opitutus sp.]
MPRWFLRFLLLFAAFGADGWAAQPKIVVRAEPPHIVRRTFDPRNPPADMPKLTPPEVGTCQYSFACTSETEIRGLRGRPARVTGIQVDARLTITLWTPAGGPPNILRHEEAHRALCEVYYGTAESTARELARKEIGQNLRASVEQKASVSAELKVIQDRLLAAFLEQTASRCEFAQKRFDAITDHSRTAVPESAAIKQAIAEERARYALTAANRSLSPASASTLGLRQPPTRPNR